MSGAQNFNSAAKFVSTVIREKLLNIPETIKKQTYEIRLRSMKPLSLVGAYGTLFLNIDASLSGITENAIIITSEDIKDTFNRICAYSIHTFQRFVNNGYIPMENGNRAGVCGTAVCENGMITNVKDISSINLRIAREIKGCADEILNFFPGEISSFIIAGAPSSGKTTIIRDIARQLSSGRNGKYVRTALIDERREISGIINGYASSDVGICTDILDSYPKSEAIDIAVRTLSPQLIICDEISSVKEVEAIKRGINCGVKFIVTVHAGSEEELFLRTQIEELLMTYTFEKVFLLGTGENIGRVMKETDSREILNEISLRRIGCNNYFGSRIM